MLDSIVQTHMQNLLAEVEAIRARLLDLDQGEALEGWTREKLRLETMLANQTYFRIPDEGYITPFNSL